MQLLQGVTGMNSLPPGRFTIVRRQATGADGTVLQVRAAP